jgi:hypothetical protein
MVDPKTPGLETVDPEEMRVRLSVANAMLDEYRIPDESRLALRFAIAVTSLLCAEAPITLAIIAHDIGERVLALHQKTQKDRSH